MRLTIQNHSLLWYIKVRSSSELMLNVHGDHYGAHNGHEAAFSEEVHAPRCQFLHCGKHTPRNRQIVGAGPVSDLAGLGLGGEERIAFDKDAVVDSALAVQKPSQDDKMNRQPSGGRVRVSRKIKNGWAS